MFVLCLAKQANLYILLAKYRGFAPNAFTAVPPAGTSVGNHQSQTHMAQVLKEVKYPVVPIPLLPFDLSL